MAIYEIEWVRRDGLYEYHVFRDGQLKTVCYSRWESEEKVRRFRESDNEATVPGGADR